MTFDDNKNSYGAVDLEGGQTSSHIKDAAADGTSRPVQNQFQGRLTPSTRQLILTQAAPLRRHRHGRHVRPPGQQQADIGRAYGQQQADMGRATGEYWRNYGMNIANQYTGGGGGHGGNTKSSGDTVINNGKYKKACKVNGGNFQDSVNWSATVNGEIIKSYCPWVWQNANRKKHCKQMQNNVLVSTACPCACAGY